MPTRWKLRRIQEREVAEQSPFLAPRDESEFRREVYPLATHISALNRGPCIRGDLADLKSPAHSRSSETEADIRALSSAVGGTAAAAGPGPPVADVLRHAQRPPETTATGPRSASSRPTSPNSRNLSRRKRHLGIGKSCASTEICPSNLRAPKVWSRHCVGSSSAGPRSSMDQANLYRLPSPVTAQMENRHAIHTSRLSLC